MAAHAYHPSICEVDKRIPGACCSAHLTTSVSSLQVLFSETEMKNSKGRYLSCVFCLSPPPPTPSTHTEGVGGLELSNCWRFTFHLLCGTVQYIEHRNESFVFVVVCWFLFRGVVDLFLFLFFIPVWWSHQQTSKICRLCSLYSTTTVTHYPQHSRSCHSMRRWSHHLEISSTTVWEESDKNKMEFNCVCVCV